MPLKFTYCLIFAGDHTRVKLIPTDDEEGSDYINANYLPVRTVCYLKPLKKILYSYILHNICFKFVM